MCINAWLLAGPRSDKPPYQPDLAGAITCKNTTTAMTGRVLLTRAAAEQTRRLCYHSLLQLQQTLHFSTSACQQEDELVLKCRQALEDIKAAGTFKVERQITTPQAASVGVKDVAQPVLNFCELRMYKTRQWCTCCRLLHLRTAAATTNCCQHVFTCHAGATGHTHKHLTP